MLKICSKCGAEKDAEEFSLHPSTSDGRDPRCKSCVSTYTRVYTQSAEGKAARAEYRQSDAGRLAQRKSDLKRHYGITIECYWEMFNSQDGVCAICKKPPIDPLSLCVDHDHSCCPGRHVVNVFVVYYVKPVILASEDSWIE